MILSKTKEFYFAHGRCAKFSRRLFEYLIIYNETIDFKIFIFIFSLLYYIFFFHKNNIHLYLTKNVTNIRSFIPEMKQKSRSILTNLSCFYKNRPKPW